MNTSLHFAWLDLVRVLSLSLVMYAHLVIVGGFAPAIPGVVGSEKSLPLLNGSSNGLNFLETFLNTFGTESGILGVVLFFLVTGFLMPLMMEKYSRTQFLVNRFFRIFPVLLVSTLVVVAWLFLTQNITFSMSSLVSTFTLSYTFTGQVPVMGVLWTLIIEVIFYFLTALVGTFTIRKLAALQTGMISVVLLAHSFPNQWTTLFANQAIFVLIICIGSSIYLSNGLNSLAERVSIIGYSVVVCYLTLQFSKLAFGTIGTYENMGTLFLGVIIFLSLFLWHQRGSVGRLPRFNKYFADLVYPLYLLHVSIGLSTIEIARNFSQNPLVLVLSAVLTSLGFSLLIHLAVEKPFISVGRRLIPKLTRT